MTIDPTIIWGGLITLTIGLSFVLLRLVFREISNLRTEDDTLHDRVNAVQRQLDRDYMPRSEIDTWMTRVWQKLDAMDGKIDALRAAKNGNGNGIKQT
jgi:hypothetical protein